MFLNSSIVLLGCRGPNGLHKKDSGKGTVASCSCLCEGISILRSSPRVAMMIFKYSCKLDVAHGSSLEVISSEYQVLSLESIVNVL